MKGYPVWFTRRFLVFLGLSLFSTGLLLLPTVIDLKLMIDVPWKLLTGQRKFVVFVHVLIGFCVIFIMGSLWSIHFRRHWKKKNKSGISLIVIVFLLMITSVLILYIGDKLISDYSSIVHGTLGLLLPVMFSIHMYTVQRD